jgi:hypothetical protein
MTSIQPQGDVEHLRCGHGRQRRRLLVNLDPELGLAVVVRRMPGIERRFRLEAAYSARIGD